MPLSSPRFLKLAKRIPVRSSWIGRSTAIEMANRFRLRSMRLRQPHGLTGKTIAVEPTQMRVIEWSLLSASATIKQASALDTIATCACAKTQAEIGRHAQSSQLTEYAFAHMLEEICARASPSAKPAACWSAGCCKQARRAPPLIRWCKPAQTRPTRTAPQAAGCCKSGDGMLFDFGAGRRRLSMRHHTHSFCGRTQARVAQNL